jgi:ribose transport system substrate-binding protein
MLAVVVAGCGGGDDDANSRTRAGVAALIKGIDNPFFATMRDGLEDTARREGVRLRVESAAGLQDTDGQAAALESLIAQRPGCYVINPINGTNLLPPLEHLPEDARVVNIDSPVDRAAAGALGIRISTYIGTDNVAAGRAAADAMARLVEPGARVAVVGGIPGDAGSGARTRGFKLGARGRFTVTRTVAADFVRSQARLAAGDLLRADPALEGMFAVNDDMALGIAQAARRLDREIAVIGVDGVPEALEAVQGGALSATVAQYPYVIGQLGLEACLASLRGEDLPARIDAPVQVVTAANVERARGRFPLPVEPFENPLTALLGA